MTPDDAVPDPEVEGRLLARRYRLGSPVGRGGMGTVWEAYDEVLGRDVAVKEVILPFGLTDQDRDTQYKRTFREARTAARLGHPGVIAVYDVVEEDRRPWIVMELIRARSLDQVIKQDGALPWRRAADIGRQMLGALHAAHEAGVLHRDVKPSNVLLGKGDRAVLTDFGIATSVGDATLTTTGLVLGSPAYIAPERARGRNAGPASDLWSLGVTLYAMLDGRSPFERSEPMASLVAIISDDHGWIEQAGPLWPVIDGLLRKDPDERLTAHEAAMILDDIVRGDAVADQPTETLVRVPQTPHEAPAEIAFAGSGPAEEIPAPETNGLAALAATMTTPSAGSGRRGMIWAVAALAVILIGGVIAAYAVSNDSAVKQLPAAVPAPTGAARSASPSVTAAPSSTAVPAGFRLYKGAGYSAAIPSDWTNPSSWANGSMHSNSPDTLSRIEFYTLASSGSALEALKSQGSGDHRQYQELRLVAVTSGPFADPTGAKAAEREYTWQSNSGKMHVWERVLQVNGRAYKLLLQGPDSTWTSTIMTLQTVLDTFTVTG